MALLGASAVNDGEIGLLDYLAICWRGRSQIIAATALPVVIAALVVGARPVRYEAEATLALSPPGFGQRVGLIVAWGVAPEGVLRPGAEVETERKDELLRVRAVASSAANATAAVDRLVVWITEAERRPADPLPAQPAPPAPPALPARPGRDKLAAWTTKLGEIERRLPTLSPGAAPYWTARALGLHGQIEAGLRPEVAPPEIAPPEVAPLGKGETAVVLQRRPARVVPKPWLWTTASAGIGGFLMLGVFALLVEQWWRMEVARRRGEPTEEQ